MYVYTRKLQKELGVGRQAESFFFALEDDQQPLLRLVLVGSLQFSANQDQNLITAGGYHTALSFAQERKTDAKLTGTMKEIFCFV